MTEHNTPNDANVRARIGVLFVERHERICA
jgi:hypothetical protein